MDDGQSIYTFYRTMPTTKRLESKHDYFHTARIENYMVVLSGLLRSTSILCNSTDDRSHLSRCTNSYVPSRRVVHRKYTCRYIPDQTPELHIRHSMMLRTIYANISNGRTCFCVRRLFVPCVSCQKKKSE